MNSIRPYLISELLLLLIVACSLQAEPSSIRRDISTELSFKDTLKQFNAEFVQTDSGFDRSLSSDEIANARILGLAADQDGPSTPSDEVMETQAELEAISFRRPRTSSSSLYNLLDKQGLKIPKAVRRLSGNFIAYGENYDQLLRIAHFPKGVKSGASATAQARDSSCACSTVQTDFPYYPLFALMGYERFIALSVLERTLYHLYSFLQIGESEFGNACLSAIHSMEISVIKNRFTILSDGLADLKLNTNDIILKQKITRTENGVETDDESLSVGQIVDVIHSLSKIKPTNEELMALDAAIDNSNLYELFRTSGENFIDDSSVRLNMELFKYMVLRTKEAAKEHSGKPIGNLPLKEFIQQIVQSGFHPFSDRFDMKWKELVKKEFGKAFMPIRIASFNKDNAPIFDITIIYTITTTVSAQGVQGYNVRAFGLNMINIKDVTELKLRFDPGAAGTNAFWAHGNKKVTVIRSKTP
jgi:hypothetical protein